MAFSPLVVQNGTTDTKVTAAKVKALAMRTHTNGFTQADPDSKTETRPELAEQLNEETKQKYIKGMWSD